MQVTGCMAWLMHHVKAVSGGSPVAEFILIGWSFGMLLEGAPSKQTSHAT